jgi:alcohol dehydrogenase class IV
VRSELGATAARLGSRAWLVVGSRALQRSGVVDELMTRLRSSGLAADVLATIDHEPFVADVDCATMDLRRRMSAGGDVVVAIGGGSAIDLAKAVAALATNRQGESVQDFLEGVGRGLVIDQPPLPLIALPTTSGTGSEATRNAVISSVEPTFKKSLRSESMVPAAMLLDPELTVSCPRHVTAHSGLDAITQLLESLLSRRANAFTSALCLEGLARALPALPVAVLEPHNRAAREAMQYAAFLSGVALANSGLGLAHGVAAALGVHCRIPHGLACAAMLPTALRFNRDVRRAELAAVGRLYAPEPSDDRAADRAIEELESLCRRLYIPGTLTELGVRSDQIEDLVASSHGNSLGGNPRDVSDAELRNLLYGLCR